MVSHLQQYSFSTLDYNMREEDMNRLELSRFRLVGPCVEVSRVANLGVLAE